MRTNRSEHIKQSRNLRHNNPTLQNGRHNFFQPKQSPKTTKVDTNLVKALHIMA